MNRFFYWSIYEHPLPTRRIEDQQYVGSTTILPNQTLGTKPLSRCQTRLTLTSLQNLGLPNWSSPLWVFHFSTQSRLKRPTTIKSSSLWYSHCLFYFSSHQKFRPIEYHIFIGIRTGQDRTDLWTFFFVFGNSSSDFLV